MVTLVPFCQIHTTLRRRLPGLDSALIAPAADAFFSIPHAPLLANTLIITSLGNVHTQELPVTESTHFSISRRVTAEEGMFAFLCLEQNIKRQHGFRNLLLCFKYASH